MLIADNLKENIKNACYIYKKYTDETFHLKLV